MAGTRAYVLAIDLGTSGPKSVIVAEDGRVVGVGRTLVESLHLPDGGAEQDARAVWQAVKASIRLAIADAAARADVPAAAIRAVICASQYSSIVPVDRDGEPLMNMVLWLDQRGSKKRLAGLPGFPRGADGPLAMLDWIRVHGLAPVAGGMSVAHMRFIKFARPEVYGRTAALLEPMDFVAMRLTGRAVATQCTSFMGLMVDNRTLEASDYHQRLLRYSLIEKAKLPELVPIHAVIGEVRREVAAELGLAPGTQVVAGMNDTQAGGMGAMAFAGTHAGLAVGSSSVLVTHAARKKTDIRNTLFTMPSPVVGQHLAVAENGISGVALESFLKNTVFAEDAFAGAAPLPPHPARYAALEEAVHSVKPGSEGLMYLPWLTGSLAPSADSRMRGGFLGMTPGTTRSHMARAVLEGIALNLRWARAPMERFVGRAFSHFVFYGGAANSRACTQVMADVMDAPIHRMADAQFATSLGAGLIAFERLGLMDYASFTTRLRISGVFEPDARNRQLYADRFGHFTEAFRALRPLARAMAARGAAA